MKKQILVAAFIAFGALVMQSCEKKETRSAEEELTLGNKLDTLTTDLRQAKDSAVIKAEIAAAKAKATSEKAAQDIKDATHKAANDVENGVKKTATDVKAATKKGAENVENAAKAAKDGTVRTAKEVNEAIKK